MPAEDATGWTGYRPLESFVSGELHEGTVREWSDDEGWGVIESAVTPGGCWAHFSSIVSSGYRTLEVGAPVAFTMEHARQDGYSYRAVQVLSRGGDANVGLDSAPSAPGAYQSTLTITIDGEQVDPEPIRREARHQAALARLEILEAFVKAFGRRTEVMAIIVQAENNDIARDQIAELLGVTDPAATAILDLQLRRFSREAMQRVRAELRRLADE